MRRTTLTFALFSSLSALFLANCSKSEGHVASGDPADSGAPVDTPDTPDAPPPFEEDPDPPAEMPPAGDAWSDPDTWPSGRVPGAGDDVTIPEGQTVLLDVSPEELGGVTIDGELSFAEADLELTAEWILVHGKLQIGRENRPFPNHATITLTGDNPDDPDTMGMGTRGILVMGGVLDLHSEAPHPIWTKIDAHADEQATELSLLEEVAWNEGDEIVLAPTDFFEVAGRTELLQVASADGASVSLAQPTQNFHWGALQYVTDAEEAIVLEPTNSVTDKVIDQRAEVGNITRKIKIQGADDALWQDDSFGAHVMVMYPGVARVDGVELTRVGQAGHLARYPFHWHMWSYESDGSERGDAEGQYIRNSAIHHSKQRCVVIHGTNGASVQDNVCFDITGHGIFLEDAVERRNVIEGNLVLTVREVSEEHMLLRHERHGFRAGPSGFWITNADNVIRNNTAADTDRIGFWYSMPEQTLGLSVNVDINPSITPFGTFENNTSHSTYAEGLLFDNVPIDEEGNTSDHQYRPVEGGIPDSPLAPFVLDGMNIYKVGVHQNGPIWDRFDGGTFRNFVISDYGSKAFAGASRCSIEDNLVVGSTLNSENNELVSQPPVGTASYHSLCQIPDNIFVNIPAVPGVVSGAFAADDYYITGVDLGLVNNGGNVLINTHPGYRSPSKNTLAPGEGLQHFAYSGALWDPYGYWGPEGNYWVLDLPFLTEGGGCMSVRDDVHGNDVSCAGPYFGLYMPRISDDGFADASRPLLVTRQDETGATLSEWFIDDGECTTVLGNMHHASLVQGGIYQIELPAGRGVSDEPRSDCVLADATPPPRAVVQSVSNLKRPEDWVMLGMPLDGSTNIGPIYVVAYPNPRETLSWSSWTCYEAIRDGAAECAEGGGSWEAQFRGDLFRPLTPVDDAVADKQAAVLEDPDCGLYFHDTANDRIWVKVCRGDIPLLTSDKTDGYGLYQDLSVVIEE